MTIHDNTIGTEVPDFAAIKTKQRAAWGSGDYAIVGVTLQIVGEDLAEAVDIRPGEHVLDVAAGNGNATLAAARRFAQVTSTDYVETLLQKGRARAEAEGMSVAFQNVDAEDMPFADGAFDTVLSTFGVMFTPNQQQSAAEMMRVCRPGGKIGLANWTPEGFIGALFKTIGKYVPPPAGVASPALWGTEAHLDHLFGAEAASIEVTRRHFNFRYRSVGHWLELFRDFYGPVHKAFAALPPERQDDLANDLSACAHAFNRATDGGMVVPSEYLEVVITKRE
ncbi:methyltransferase domain-containing protein [Rhodobacteraceae bacterium NNCM2]|nr:methyltransferase domain-containing protein [Coraliihabitans acroporae]